jgi:hypothetical protein
MIVVKAALEQLQLIKIHGCIFIIPPIIVVLKAAFAKQERCAENPACIHSRGVQTAGSNLNVLFYQSAEAEE